MFRRKKNLRKNKQIFGNFEAAICAMGLWGIGHKATAYRLFNTTESSVVKKICRLRITNNIYISKYRRCETKESMAILYASTHNRMEEIENFVNKISNIKANSARTA